jgi:hypothetical protein
LNCDYERRCRQSLAPPAADCVRELVFALVLANFHVDTRRNSGENEGGDIDFAVFHILPVLRSLSAK